MTELLPGVQAPAIQESILDYLATTFALADEDVRIACSSSSQTGQRDLQGPLPPAAVAVPAGRRRLAGRARSGTKGFPPYGHQAAAFARLTSLDLGPDKPRPLPTLVTTGTGSGKTEAFLYPILDHVAAGQARGVTGTKALILYPMNALANDQAQRLADLLTTHRRARRGHGGLYTGEQGPQRTRRSARTG